MQGIMHVFVTSNFKKDQIDSSRKSGDINFVDAQGQLTLYSVVGVGRNFQLTQAFMYVLQQRLPASMERIQFEIAEKE